MSIFNGNIAHLALILSAQHDVLQNQTHPEKAQLLLFQTITAMLIAKQKVRQAYIAESLERPITKITPRVVDFIVQRTGIDGKTVEDILIETNFYLSILPLGKLCIFKPVYQCICQIRQVRCVDQSDIEISVSLCVFAWERRTGG